MMFNRFSGTKMANTSASASYANADCSCADTANTANTANTAIIAIMDAIIMASIIIYGLVLGLRAIALFAMAAIMVLVAGIVIRRMNRHWYCELSV